MLMGRLGGIGKRIGWLIVSIFAVHGAALAQDWTAQTSGSTNLLNDVWFTDAQRGFAVGNGGTVLETVDGGETWAPRALTADDLLDVAFLDVSTGLIVGDNGTVLRTTDRGTTWVPVISGTTNNLAGVAFGGDGLAYAAGRDGTIVRSTDAGATWTFVETGIDRYRAVAAVGQNAWIVGDGGVIRATKDGGDNWTFLSSGTVSDLHAVWFVSTSEGWAGGQNNMLLYTNDGGATWTPRDNSIGVGLNTVFFGNSNLGWAGGASGDAFQSKNGGMGWVNQPTPTANEINGAHFADAFNGWAVGDSGTILTHRVASALLMLAETGLRWEPTTDAVAFDVMLGDLVTLRRSAGDFAAATERCLADDLAGNFLAFDASPLAGQGYWFLIRVDGPAADPGTYDSSSFLQSAPRDAGIGASAAGCP